MNNLTIKNNEHDFAFAKCANSIYLIDTESIVEIIKIPRLEYPQKLPRYISGIFDYRGLIVNTADLRSVLGLELKPYDKDTIVVILKDEENEKIVSLALDGIEKIEKIDTSFVKPAQLSGLNPLARGVYVRDNETLILLDIKKILRRIFESIENGEPSDMPSLLPSYDIEIYQKRSLEYKNTMGMLPIAEFNNNNSYVTFSANETTYCIRSAFVKSFYKLNQEKITPIPSSKDFIVGILNIKGEYISIIDMNIFFGRERVQVNQKTIIVIPEAGEFKIGILADSVGESINIENVEQTPENEVNYVQNNEIYYILNIQNILNDEKLYLK